MGRKTPPPQLSRADSTRSASSFLSDKGGDARWGLLRQGSNRSAPGSSNDENREICFRRHIELEESSGEQEFFLKRRIPGRHAHGMDWQQDPRSGASVLLHPHRGAPKDYATIRGTVFEHDGKKWLAATEIKPAGESKFVAAPKGSAIPFFFRKEYCLVRSRSKDLKRDDSVKSWTEEAMNASHQWSSSSSLHVTDVDPMLSCT